MALRCSFALPRLQESFEHKYVDDFTLLAVEMPEGSPFVKGFNLFLNRFPGGDQVSMRRGGGGYTTSPQNEALSTGGFDGCLGFSSYLGRGAEIEGCFLPDPTAHSSREFS